MAELICLRKRRLDVLKDERVEEIKKSTPSLHENPERAKAKGGARAATALGKAPKETSSKDASSKASPPKTAGSKRLSSEVKGKGVADSEKKRLKSLDSTKDCVEISQFGALLKEGTLIPDYSSFAQSHRIENAWGYLAEMCTETNHAFISYEADLKAQRGEIADLKRKLKEAASLAETEKTTAEKTQKKLDKLRSKLNDKGVENNKLKEELVTARQSREAVEKEIRERLFDKVHERCELVKHLLTQFRYGPALQANFYGQAKNNLDFVRSLLSKNPPDLKEEKAKLKKEMKEYSKAPKEYEGAFNRLAKVLSFEGGEFENDEAGQIDEKEEEEVEVDSEDDEDEGTRGRSEKETLQGNEQEQDQKMGDGEENQETEGQIVKDSEDQAEGDTALDKNPGVEEPADSDAGAS